MLTIAIQGERGAYSEQAARTTFQGEIELILCDNFEALCQAVDLKNADFALLPVENSSAGSVVPAYDALIASNCKVIGEQTIEVHHCLLANHGVALQDIKKAISHPQALAQSAQFLKTNHIEPGAFYDTAGSAKELANKPRQETAAIASQLAADIYGLTVLAENIEDLSNNQTRFLILSDKSQLTEQGPYKSILYCHLKHEPGALVELLNRLAKTGANLTKIESRPDRQTPFQYQFIIDLVHINPIKNVIDFSHDLIDNCRVLGTYRSEENGSDIR